MEIGKELYISKPPYISTLWARLVPCLYPIKDLGALAVPFNGFHWISYSKDLPSHTHYASRRMSAQLRYWAG